MSMQLHPQVKTMSAPTPSLTLVRTGLLQRTCACGGAPGIDGECAECRGKRLILRSAQRGFEAPSVSAVPQGESPTQENASSLDSIIKRASHFGCDFSHISLYSRQTAVPQTKLEINQPGDVYEREADQAAEEVMRMTDLEASVPDDKDQAKNSLVHKQSIEPPAHAAADIPSIPPVIHAALNSSEGQSLDTTTRAFMETRFGHDFSRVRVHTDTQADHAARSVNALAFTVGQDVVFGRGHYTSGTDEGRKLLAHELAYVIQQGGSRKASLSNIGV